uniref:Flagellar M-ring protein n=1 Tax=Glossina pallidipes TaxID=7398 RepID=A0A1A9Z106_GLOPL
MRENQKAQPSILEIDGIKYHRENQALELKKFKLENYHNSDLNNTSKHYIVQSSALSGNSLLTNLISRLRQCTRINYCDYKQTNITSLTDLGIEIDEKTGKLILNQEKLNHNAEKNWTEEKILDANPKELIDIVFDILHTELKKATFLIKNNQIATKGESISYAISIIESILIPALNNDRDFLLVQNLKALYIYFIRTLLEANLNNDIKKVEHNSIITHTPDYQVLYSNISDQDGGEIITELSSANIPYKFSHGNGAIMIPADQVYKTRLMLAQKNLPKRGSVGFEILDNSSFGMSQFNEQINYQRALEGEIARTIETIDSIKFARVHIAIPKSSVFVKDKQPAKASITLTLYPGRILDENQIQAITWLISGTIPNLPANNIILVDNHGKLLTRPEHKANSSNVMQLQYIREIESEYRRRIEAILTPIVGTNNIRSEVVAQIDFTKTEQTLEQHKPNTDPKEMTIRSQQTTENKNFSKLPEGVPGALSNQPSQPSSAIIPDSEDENNQSNSQSLSESLYNDSEKSSNIQNEKTINYEIDRTITHNEFSPGSLKKLSVAVVINYRSNLDGNQVKLNEQEMQDINSLVREAMGYSEKRGDTVNIVNMSFVDNQEELSHLNFWENPRLQNIIFSVFKYIISFLAIWFAWNKFMKMWKQQQKNQQNMINKINLQKEENILSEEQKIQIQNQKNIENNNTVIESNIQELKEIAEKQPKLVAKILSQWIKKEQKTL